MSAVGRSFPFVSAIFQPDKGPLSYPEAVGRILRIETVEDRSCPRLMDTLE